MFVTVRTLNQKTFKIEIDATASVSDLKEKIEADQGKDFPAQNLKLIYSGKILEDKDPLTKYEIDENKFLVVMVQKPKPAPPTPAPAPQVTLPSAPATTPASTTPAAPTPANTTATTPAAASGGESLLLSGSDFNRTVENIVAMGYERPQVERALRASFNNADRAVEYLITGIPAEFAQVEEEGAPVGGEQGAGGQQEEEDNLAFLRSQPQFEQMRQVVRENPQLLNALLQQIGQTNPALLQAISENQEEFVRLLNEDTGAPPSGGAAAPAAGGGGGPFQLQISPQDKEAIDRLKALGFPEHMVVQAYFACDKNENLAANFLFQNEDD